MNKKNVISIMFLLIVLVLICLKSYTSKETVIIYTSMEGYRIERMNYMLRERFPKYDIIIEYLPTGNHAAKLLAEGINTECHITHNLEYGYLEQLDEAGVLADLSSIDKAIFMEDTIISQNIIPQERNGGCILLNTKVLAERGLQEPTSYEDLLKPEYKGLISMPSPKASGTGYMFLKSLVNIWGENKTFEYFDKLSVNVLQFTSSGSGPLNAILQGEVAIGLGMTAPAVTEVNEGQPIKIIYFEEGSPFSLYGQSIIKGNENNPVVMEVFNFLFTAFNEENCKNYFPEKLYKNKDYIVKNYPLNIKYANMNGNTSKEKARLLAKWKY